MECLFESIGGRRRRAAKTTRFVNQSNYSVVEHKHNYRSRLYGLVELSDGTLVSCSGDTTARRYLIETRKGDQEDNDKQNMKNLGFFLGMRVLFDVQ